MKDLSQPDRLWLRNKYEDWCYVFSYITHHDNVIHFPYVTQTPQRLWDALHKVKCPKCKVVYYVKQDLYYWKRIPKERLPVSKHCVTCPKCGTKSIQLRG